MFLRTNRLLIREFEPGDWKAVLEYTSNPVVMKYIPEGVFTKEMAKEFVTNQVGEEVKYFPVVEKAHHKMIGHIFFHKYFGEHTYEIGWVFHPSFHNKGYAYEAALAIVEYGFENMNLHRIVATCQPENIPSYCIMEKLGMRREGFFKKCIPTKDGWWDEYYYAILQEEWKLKRTV